MLGILVYLGLGSVSAQDQRFRGDESVSYEDCIAAYESFCKPGSACSLIEIGTTDVGKPLHLFIMAEEGPVELAKLDRDKPVLLINNGIHPGEPCGVDGSIQLAERILNGGERYAELLKHVNVCIIPMYNVGGALNRGCCSRANQNGPQQYGFRGNARNLDLNRDFIKNDSKNARSFTEIFHQVRPTVFLDTHTSNGADYQYVMTMITTQPDKASEDIGTYIREEMNPRVYELMEERGWGMTPYVHTMGRTPDDGIKDFLETPRYSTGYAALFNTIGFTSETHMFKPFEDRVEGTYQFELALLDYMASHADELVEMKRKADEAIKSQSTYALQWELDTNNWETIDFKGFEAQMVKSDITGQERLYYDRELPWEKPIRYFNRYRAKIEVEKPNYYIIPQAWSDVVDRLTANGVHLTQIEKDLVIDVEAYHIVDFETTDRVYEGHYLHSDVKVEKVIEPIQFYQGDFVVATNQKTNKYIVETLEPQGVDSYFAWNYFDSVLQQKEWFSDYVFEDKAEQMLAGNDELRIEFEAKKEADEQFASNHWWMLYWLYQRSEHFEQSFNRYPVYRYNGGL